MKRRTGRPACAGAALFLAAFACPWPIAAADLAQPAGKPGFVDWSGGYLGIQGSAGASFGNFEFGPTTVGNRRVGTLETGDSTGQNDLNREATASLGGVFGGWNWQSGGFVYGLEADLVGANLKRPLRSDLPGLGYEAVDPPFGLVRERMDLIGTGRLRLGYAFERNLVYASVGIAGASAHVAAAYPDLVAGGVNTARKDLSYLGFTLGAGVQYAITPNLSLGLDYRYVDFGQTDRFDLGTIPGPGGGRVSTRAASISNEMMVRLYWHPEGLALPAEADDASPSEPSRFSLHGQTTFVNQGVSGFRSPYQGDQSLLPHQAQATTTATAYLGLKLFEGTELYYNPEFSQGFGLSRTLGVAGFVNGEAQKAGAPFPKLRSNRYFVKQTFGLGGETEQVPDGPNAIAGARDVERITLVAGKFALGDYFDNNAYAHDSRVDFMNWGLWASGAYDFPANLPGFTQGVMAEYNRAEFAFRAAYTQVPKRPSSDVLDPRLFDRQGLTAEFEERHTLPWLDQPGKLRLGIFSNVGNTARYRETVALTQAGAFTDVNDAAAAARAPRRKTGFYANLEQAVTSDVGVFARASVGDGRTENLSFTDVDRSLSGGVSIKGARWGRPQDTVGLGVSRNELSAAHRAFFAAGGLGLVIGDGRLTYSPEVTVEAYYSLNLTTSVTVSFDYQHVENPGYNRDRGPADFFGTRLHAEF